LRLSAGLAEEKAFDRKGREGTAAKDAKKGKVKSKLGQQSRTTPV
jgi:hypothetical protein